MSNTQGKKKNSSPRSNQATIPGGMETISIPGPVDTGHYTFDETSPRAPIESDSSLLTETQQQNKEMEAEYQARERFGPVPALTSLAAKSMGYINNSQFIEEDSWESARITQCLEIGLPARFFGKTPDAIGFLSRNDVSKRFRNELSLLTDLLTIVERYDPGNDSPVGYRVKKDLWIVFTTALNERRNRVKDTLNILGEGEPPLPLWTGGGTIDSFWSPNDYEIYATVYRYEVEQLLKIISKAEKHEENKLVPGSPASSTSRRSDQRAIIDEVGPLSSISNARERARAKTSYTSTDNSKKLRFRQQEEDTDLGTGYKSEEDEPTPSQLPTSPLSALVPANRLSATLRPSAATHAAGRGLKALFPERDRPPHQDNSSRPPAKDNSTRRTTSNFHRDLSSRRQQGTDPDPEPSDSDSSDNGKGHPRKLPRKIGRQGISGTPVTTANTVSFDQKLKVDIIPTWDGNSDSLGRWLSKINRLSERSALVYDQLGILVPTRLRDSAETWYYSMNPATRTRIEQDWGTLREAIGAYFMNRSFLDKQKARANRMAYRDSNGPRETPSDYFIRKLELLELVYNYSDTELINEIMAGAPSSWTAILTPHLYHNIEDFQRIVKFHEESLMLLNSSNSPSRPFNRFSSNSRNPFTATNENGSPISARTNLVGWTKQTLNPPFPKDDSNVSPRGTPISKGGRPCRHCGSGNHWDPECKYARKGEKRARVNHIVSDDRELNAQNQYDELYYSLVSDEEDEDFQITSPLNQPQ